MPKNIFVLLQMLWRYLKHQKWYEVIWNIKNKGIIFTFLLQKKRNLDSKIANVENLKTQKFSPAKMWLAQFLKLFLC